MLHFKISILFLIFVNGLFCIQEDLYYWRDYNGTIPADAISGGKDANSRDIYIAQAYIHDIGVIPAELFRGAVELQVPIKGVRNIKKYIKVLCGSESNFYWSPANATLLHTQLIEKRPILGGHENNEVLYIGRIIDEGHTKVGKITPYFREDAKFWYNQRGTEKSVTSYEILLNNDYALDIRLGDR